MDEFSGRIKAGKDSQKDADFQLIARVEALISGWGMDEALRRDKHARALLDVNSTAWTALLKALLGHPSPAYAATAAGRGVLLRLLIGESLRALLRDDDLVLMISLAAPKRRGRS